MAGRKPTNSAVARGISTAKVSDKSWLVFDALPPAVREAIWSAPVSVNPLTIEPLLANGWVEAIAALQGAIDREVQMFAEQHRLAYGSALPHVAAGATLQRYRR